MEGEVLNATTAAPTCYNGIEDNCFTIVHLASLNETASRRTVKRGRGDFSALISSNNTLKLHIETLINR
jgi:hypothetical protein